MSEDTNKKNEKRAATLKKNRRRGRPTVYSDKLAKDICVRIASGESLRSICRDTKMPAIASVMLWLVDGEHKYLSEHYARARQIQAEILADEIFDVADDARNDWMKKEDPKNPGYQFNGEAVARSRLRVDARKWYLSKIVPRFADKKQIDLTTAGESLNKGRKLCDFYDELNGSDDAGNPEDV